MTAVESLFFVIMNRRKHKLDSPVTMEFFKEYLITKLKFAPYYNFSELYNKYLLEFNRTTPDCSIIYKSDKKRRLLSAFTCL
mgnify:FL=1